MSEPDDIDALAGEYVLGTLDAAERAEVGARRLREPSLNAAILAWENRLAPLDLAVPEIAPNPGTWTQILVRLNALSQPGQESSIIDLTQRLNRWRAAAVVSSGIAAALAIAFIGRETARVSPPQNFVAVLQEEGAMAPFFIVEMDLKNHLMTVRPVAAGRQPGKSYELWLIHAKFAEPKSLGVVADQGFTVKPTLAKYDQESLEDGTYAITLEQAGGSPDGKPSGPPLWTGKLVQATP